LSFRPDRKSWARGIFGITRRIGMIWWGGYYSTFWIDFYKPTCLYLEIKPLLYQEFETTLSTTKNLTGIERLFKALEVLANYFNKNYYCKISVTNLEDKRISFDIQDHPFAAMDDKGFYMFWGVLDMFCEWLSPPIKTQPKDDAKLIEIDEKSSTTTQIIIVYPYKW